MTTFSTTQHCINRAKDRCNVKNQRSAEKNIYLAMERGKRAEDCTSWERSYLSKEGYDNCVAIAYNNFCYIFNEHGTCVTVYELPSWFGKKKHFNGKERIRNYKQYCRNHTGFGVREAIC